MKRLPSRPDSVSEKVQWFTIHQPQPEDYTKFHYKKGGWASLVAIGEITLKVGEIKTKKKKRCFYQTTTKIKYTREFISYAIKGT